MAHARTTDPETSHEAAASVRNENITHRRILNILERMGKATDEALVAEYRRKYGSTDTSESGIRSRRAELVRMGKVEFTGERGLTASNRSTRVWTLS